MVHLLHEVAFLLLGAMSKSAKRKNESLLLKIKEMSDKFAILWIRHNCVVPENIHTLPCP